LTPRQSEAATAPKAGFNVVTEHSQKIYRQVGRSELRETRRSGDLGSEIRESKNRFPVQRCNLNRSNRSTFYVPSNISDQP
jgi:hypothetical protein